MLSRFDGSIAPLGGQSLSMSCVSFGEWYSQGESLLNQQDYQRALRCFEEAVILVPEDQEALLHQAVCLVHLEQPEKALEVLSRLVELAPNHAQGWLFHGVALHRLGRYREAYASYDRALGKPPRVGFWSRFKQRLTQGLSSALSQ